MSKFGHKFDESVIFTMRSGIAIFIKSTTFLMHMKEDSLQINVFAVWIVLGHTNWSKYACIFDLAIWTSPFVFGVNFREVSLETMFFFCRKVWIYYFSVCLQLFMTTNNTYWLFQLENFAKIPHVFQIYF